MGNKCPFSADKYGIMYYCNSSCMMREGDSCLIREYLAAALTRERQSGQVLSRSDENRAYMSEEAFFKHQGWGR